MNTITTWEKEVFEFNTKINNKLQHDEKAESLYYGFDVIDGKIIENPDILFVGINPGQGNGERHYEVKMESNRMSYLDVFNEDYREDYKKGYSLAEFAIDIVRNLEVKEDEVPNYLSEKCVKTNLYHIVTDGTSEMNSVFKNIDSFNDYYNKSNYFCIELIKTIKPKIVIFEGVSAYNPIIQDCCEAKNTWNEKGNLAYFKIEDLNAHCIGYKRNNRAGTEIDAKSVADKIKSLNVL